MKFNMWLGVKPQEDKMEPIIEVECKERDGTVNRKVYPMFLTPENLRDFFDRVKDHPTLFNSEVRGDFAKFVSVFLDQESAGGTTILKSRGLFWRVDDFVGVFYLTDIILNQDAAAHFTFFDSRINGRENLTLEMLRYVFRKYKFQRLTVELPLYVTVPTLKFVEQLGFTHEGCKRLAIEFDGKFFDVNIYGILAEEILPELKPRLEDHQPLLDRWHKRSNRWNKNIPQGVYGGS
jgi:hypothetical protein